MENNEKTKLGIYKNISGVALQIPELNIMIPADGFSGPITETPTIKVFMNKNLITLVETVHAQLPTEQALSAEPKETKPIDVTSKQPVVVLPITQHKSDVIIKNYEQKAGIRDAISNTKVELDGQSTVITTPRGADFATEVPMEEHIKDQAIELMKQSRVARSDETVHIKPLPNDASKELTNWFSLQPSQKKINIYKSTDTTFLESLANYETDSNIVACINQKLTELAKDNLK